MLRQFILFVFLLVYAGLANAQCTTAISTFPYQADFESNDGGWIAGGTASDWAWGTPTKPVIHTAASGSKCWITGGLSESSYSNGENSWLQSPCFDFSLLVNPRISFYVFWETEKNFDGGSLQYSTDGGLLWITLGTINEPNCTTVNWYNSTSVNFLGTNGWSGSTQPASGSCVTGNGSGMWVEARHDLPFLAGKPSVKFRFRFAAGTICNAYDGFAIDKVLIGEVLPPTADFIYSCGAGNSISFTSTGGGCPTVYAWDFGDVASLGNNTSSLANPVHTFSSPGSYVVKLTESFASGPQLTVSKTINVINVTINVVNDLKCNGDKNGALTAAVSGGTVPFNYSWNTTPVQSTAAISNLGTGNYTVTVTGPNACPTTASLSISEPAALNAAINTTAALCGKVNGSAAALITGGTPIYSYLWSNGGITTTISNLAAGTYTFKVTDANGCSFSNNNILIENQNKNLNVFLGNDTVICPGQSFVLNPGNFFSYLWQDNSSNPTFTVKGSGTYSVTVTDADGCTGSDAVNIIADCSDIFFPSAFTPDKNGRNDLFGAFGNIGAVKNYSLKVYHRWGQLIFSSTDPAKRWDGTFGGEKLNTGAYAWVVSYNINGGTQKVRKGTVMLLH